jgi:hypothetical protein
VKRARLRRETVRSYLTVCKLQELEKDYPYSSGAIDIEQAKLTYMLLITAQKSLNALLQDVGAAIERYSEKEGRVEDAYLDLIRDQN